MKQLYRKSEVVAKETSLVYTYWLLAFLAGAFLSLFDVMVHAKFLEIYGYRFLASAYVISGLIGAGLTFIYSLFFRRIHTKPLNLSITAGIILFVCTYLVQLVMLPSNLNSYVGMVILFPVNILVLLTLWRFGRIMLYRQQSKEILPSTRISHLAGLAAGGLVTPPILFYLYSFKPLAFLTMGILLAYGVTYVLLFRVHRKSKQFNPGKDTYIPIANNFMLFFRTKLTRNLYMFTLLSAIIGFSIHFVFINIAVAGFQNVIGFSKFYGLFIAAIMIFIFGVDKYLIRRILYSYDSPYSLFLIPVLILAILVVTIIGNIFFSHFQPHEHFTVFFLLLALTKVGYESSKSIIQIPSSRALFQTLDIRYRQVVHPRIEGTAILFGLLIAGLIILSLSLLKIFTINLILYFIAFASAVWLYVGIMLVKSYKKMQTQTLERLRFRKTGLLSESLYEERIWNTLTGDDLIKINCILSVLSTIKPAIYEKYLERMLVHPNKEVVRLVLKNIMKERIIGLSNEIMKKVVYSSSNEKEALLQALDYLNNSIASNKSSEELKEIVFTGTVEEKIELAASVAYTSLQEEEKELLLFELIKDVETVVQDTALKSLTRFDKNGFNYILLDFIYPENYNPYVMDIIAHSGSDALDYLEQELLLPEASNIVQARIYKLYGRIGGQRAINNILTSINTQERTVLMQSLQALIDNQFQANRENKYKLLNLIVKQVGIIAQTLNYYKHLFRKRKLKQIAEAYRQEIDYNYELLFKLLSLVYNPNIITSLRNLFLNGSHSEINHGVELIDQYIDDEIKLILQPLFENISINDRIKKLEYYFIQPKINAEEILKITLTQDYNTLSLYPRACVMMHILKNTQTQFLEELLFNTYHPEPILSETAAYVLTKIHSGKLEEIISNNKDNINLAKQVDRVKRFGSSEDLLYYRFVDIKSFPVFYNISEPVTLKLAQNAEKIVLNKKDVLNIHKLNKDYKLLLSHTNTFKNTDNSVTSGYLGLFEMNMLTESGISELRSETDTWLWLFPKQIVTELLFDYVDLTNIYFKVIENMTFETK